MPGATRVSKALSIGLLTTSFFCHTGVAAPRSADRPTMLVQGTAQVEIQQQLEAQPTPSKKIEINVFTLSEQPKNPDEVLVSRGSRYTYFSSRRLTSPTRPLGEPRPRYPEGRKAERGGAVILQLLINERGGLDHVDVLCSAPTFEKSAVDSVRGLKFKPAQDKNGAVKSYMWVEFAYGRGFPCASVPD